ncbi:MAG TPA: hypothetical protein VJ720_13660, partial [Chitinophaga sp.]|nr:hypothetical protein [Chitinophaga sp.]
MKIRQKILILFTALTVSIIVLMSAFAYYLISRHSFEDFYKRLEIRAYIAARATLTNDKENSATYAELRRAHLERLPFEQEYIIHIDSAGNIPRKAMPKELPATFYSRVKLNGKATYRNKNTFYEGVLYDSELGTHIVIVSAQNAYGAEYMAELKRILLICLAIAAVVVVTAGLFFSRYI